MAFSTRARAAAVTTGMLLAVLSACGTDGTHGANHAEQVGYCGQPALGIVGENQTTLIDLTHDTKDPAGRLRGGYHFLRVQSGQVPGPQIIVKVAGSCTRGAAVSFSSPGVVRILAEDRAQDGKPAGIALVGARPGETTLVARWGDSTRHVLFTVASASQDGQTPRSSAAPDAKSAVS